LNRLTNTQRYENVAYERRKNLIQNRLVADLPLRKIPPARFEPRLSESERYVDPHMGCLCGIVNGAATGGANRIYPQIHLANLISTIGGDHSMKPPKETTIQPQITLVQFVASCTTTHCQHLSKEHQELCQFFPIPSNSVKEV